MNAKKASAPPIVTCEAIASFVTVLTPRAIQNKDGTAGRPKYSITLVFPIGAPQKYLPGPVDISALKQAASACAIADVGQSQLEKLLKIGKFRTPFLSADDPAPNGEDITVGEQYGWPAGAIYIRASSIRKPQVASCYADADGRPKVMTDEEVEKHLYAGCRVRASLRPYTYNVNNRGVTFDLRSVQWLGDDVRLGGGDVKASNEFEPTASAADMAVEGEDGTEAPAPAVKRGTAKATRGAKSLEDLL